MSERKTIAQVEHGKRTVLGTDWPITSYLERVAGKGRRPTWVVTWNLCNGVPTGTTVYPTKREALEALHS